MVSSRNRNAPSPLRTVLLKRINGHNFQGSVMLVSRYISVTQIIFNGLNVCLQLQYKQLKRDT